jgi:hypothetical protein
VYTWGDPDNPGTDYAFKLVNNDEKDYTGSVGLRYTFDDDGWLDGGNSKLDQSFLSFQLHHGGFTSTLNAPAQFNGRTSPSGLGTDSNGNTFAEIDPLVTSDPFNSGDEWFITITVDTTGMDAEEADQLSGNLTIKVE